jgi:hypothetical protein
MEIFQLLYSRYYCPPNITKLTTCQIQSHIATDGRLVSQSVLVSSPDIYYCLTVTVLLLWGALSDERTGLSFVRVIVYSSNLF